MKVNHKLPAHTKISLGIVGLLIAVIVYACNDSAGSQLVYFVKDTVSPDQQRLPESALKGLVVASGLEVRTMVTEPVIKNPTNIDVDERGRVWVTEAYNYRPAINGNPVNPEGDRIVILEDKDGDGLTEDAKVYYQGPELNAPLGICVLGNRVLVSQSPYVWAFYDDNGDDKADRKEILFQGMGGEQHDHGMHTFIFGPDGKLYFNFGNEGKTLKDKNGKVVLDQDGDEIGPKKYRQGMLFRCDPDGSNVECLGHNFRNNYEAAVDSYGTMWQSDNDDDGNRGVRINYVMDYGNYGYQDEVSGASWQASRTNMEDSIPLRHWHLNDPGVVPNLLQTGAGSPTGIVFYEGTLLPEPFRNQVIHCDAGPNVVRAYPVKKQGAGYHAEMLNVLKGEKDQWFRPADVCVAPDGSLVIADWYDPGVGGHQAGDQQRGRIYRVAPPGSKYTITRQDYATPSGAVKALQNPNLAVRHHAWMELQKMGQQAVPELEALWKSASADPRMRARAFWVLVKMPQGNKYLKEAIKDNNPDLRITGLRAARQLKTDVAGVVSQLVKDADPQVRRECALALRHDKSREAAQLWTTLANQYDGKDRWYLEALGIGADGQWDPFFTALMDQVKDPLQNPLYRDIIWRARTDKAVPFLAKLASEETTDLKSRLRYFRAFDFNPGPAKSTLLVKMIEDNRTNNSELNKMVLHHLDLKTVNGSPIAQNAIKDVLRSVDGTSEYLELVRKYEISSENPRLLALAMANANERLGRDAAGTLFQLKGGQLAQNVIMGKDTARTLQVLSAISRLGGKESIDMLEAVTLSKSYPLSIRSSAAEMIGRSQSGEDRVLALLKTKKVPQELIPPFVAGVRRAWRKSVYTEALTYLPGGGTISQEKKVPVLAELAALKPNLQNGKTVFKTICATCHMVNKEGFDFGPKLTEIGSKLAKEGMLEAIVYPSKGISFGYESWQLDMKDASKLTGIIGSRTETDIDLKYPGGVVQKVKTGDVKKLNKLPESLMPEGLHEAMTTQQLADLVEYLSSLRKSDTAPLRIEAGRQ
ncbi:MAG: PVC-type heme-binding CxxCH protein [Chitinophagaceae bacterium]